MLVSVALLIGVARILGELARRFHQPAILGELLAGVVLGPTVLGTFAPEFQSTLFPREGPNALVLNGIGSLAIVLFLLVAGMEVDLSVVWKQGRSALKVGVLGVIVPFASGLLAAWLFPQVFGRQADADPVVFTLFVATAMAISALPVIAKTLMDLDLYRTDLGMVVVSAAMFDDLTGWTLFALILGMMGAGHSGLSVPATFALTLIYVGVMLTAGRWLMHKSIPFLQAYTHFPGGVLGFAVTVALLGAAFTEFIGIHAIFGAFIVGVALGDSTHLSERTRVMLDEFVSFIFAPLYFASIGLKVDFVANFDPMLVVSILLLACVGKIFGAYWGARWGGFSQRDRWAISIAMNSRGAMEIILGILALQAGIIREPLFVALFIMAVVTSAISGPLIRIALNQRKPNQVLSFLSPKAFIPELNADSRRDAIRELAAAAGQLAGIDAARIESLAWEREKVVATGIGHGVAIPHARIEGIKEPIVAIGVSEAGVDFDAPDGQPAHVVFLLVTPHDDPAAQLELSANISHLFRNPRCLERVIRAKNFTETLAALKSTPVR